MKNTPALFLSAKDSLSLEHTSKKKETRQRRLLRDRLATPGEEYLPRGRYILNARSLFPQSKDYISKSPKELVALASELAARAGKLVAKYSTSSSPNHGEDEEWISFLQLSGELRFVHLSNDIPLSFWLNVYHVMVCHAGLLFGAPARSVHFARHFGTLCYECAGDVFSLAELEHCIIRNALPRPRLLLSDTKLLGSSALDLLRIASATSTKTASSYSFALNNTNPMLGLALNPGGDANSCPVVPIYNDEHIDTQISAVITAVLANTKLRGSFLILPRKCAWHSIPFHHLKGQLPPDIQLALASNNFQDDVDIHGPGDSSSATDGFRLKYLPFDYQCHPPRILEHELALAELCAYTNTTTTKKQKS
uniref:DUF547 domain-containing protein n=1 Tax=Aureoumbra lagunensis TaxID=44058 RepID=A0A7S3K0M1_9STRA